jgi:GMP synthase (glutamine-hydrolysing)
MARVLALRHVAFEDLGLLEDLFAKRGHDFSYVEVPIGGLEGIDPAEPDLLVVLGGPIGVYEEAAYPFLVPEIRFIEKRLAAGRPTLGLCLGAQLMARALGARVYPAPVKELGWSPLTITEAGLTTPLRHVDGSVTSVLHWHGDTFDLPADATLLASTGHCPHQAYSYGPVALALQFHAEVVMPGLERWFVGHTLEISQTPGVEVATLRAESRRWSPVVAEAAGRLFNEWLAGVGL